MRGLLKWILCAILLIIVVILILSYAKRTEQQKPIEETPVDIVEQQPQEEPTESLQEEAMDPNLVVDSPNTASSGFPQMMIGTIIIAFGIRYVYKKGKLVKGNS